MLSRSPSFPRSPAGIGRGRRQRRLPPGVAHPVDVHVGQRLRLRRTMLGMSQERLGEAVGLTFQQIQKYERGANRVGSSRLYQFSRILDVPVSFFFEDMPADALDSDRIRASGMSDHDQQTLDQDPLARQETLKLVQAYYRITDPKVRRKLFELIRAMANLPEPD